MPQTGKCSQFFVHLLPIRVNANSVKGTDHKAKRDILTVIMLLSYVGGKIYCNYFFHKCL